VLRSELYQLFKVEATNVLPERSGRKVGKHAQMIARPFSIVAQVRSPPVLTSIRSADLTKLPDAVSVRFLEPAL